MTATHPPTRAAAPSAHPPVSLPASGVRLCSVEGCAERHHARGACKNHYRRLWLNGDPLGGVWPTRPNPWAGQHACPTCGSADWTLPVPLAGLGPWRCVADGTAFDPAAAGRDEREVA